MLAAIAPVDSVTAAPPLEALLAANLVSGVWSAFD
jgi:hypothetical protein